MDTKQAQEALELLDRCWHGYGNAKELVRSLLTKAAEGKIRKECNRCTDGFVYDIKCPECNGKGWIAASKGEPLKESE